MTSALFKLLDFHLFPVSFFLFFFLAHPIFFFHFETRGSFWVGVFLERKDGDEDAEKTQQRRFQFLRIQSNARARPDRRLRQR